MSVKQVKLCDECGGRSNETNGYALMETEDWWEVRKRGHPGSESIGCIDLDFCSLECLQAWAQKTNWKDCGGKG